MCETALPFRPPPLCLTCPVNHSKLEQMPEETSRPSAGAYEFAVVDTYREALAVALRARGRNDQVPSRAALATALDLAYADLARFMAGWRWSGGEYVMERAQTVLDTVDGGRPLESAEIYEHAVLEAYPLLG